MDRSYLFIFLFLHFLSCCYVSFASLGCVDNPYLLRIPTVNNIAHMITEFIPNWHKIRDTNENVCSVLEPKISKQRYDKLFQDHQDFELSQKKHVNCCKNTPVITNFTCFYRPFCINSTPYSFQSKRLHTPEEFNRAISYYIAGCNPAENPLVDVLLIQRKQRSILNLKEIETKLNTLGITTRTIETDTFETSSFCSILNIFKSSKLVFGPYGAEIIYSMLLNKPSITLRAYGVTDMFYAELTTRFQIPFDFDVYDAVPIPDFNLISNCKPRIDPDMNGDEVSVFMHRCFTLHFDTEKAVPLIVDRLKKQN
jgi:hypothetical protein